jgi:hypothetical protein
LPFFNESADGPAVLPGLLIKLVDGFDCLLASGVLDEAGAAELIIIGRIFEEIQLLDVPGLGKDLVDILKGLVFRNVADVKLGALIVGTSSLRGEVHDAQPLQLSISKAHLEPCQHLFAVRLEQLGRHSVLILVLLFGWLVRPLLWR